MRSNGWWAGALAAVTMVAGCAHQNRVSEAQLGRLPIGEKNALFAAQHNISVAEANQAAAKKAYGQAKQFQDIMGNETKLAKDHANVARQTFDLGRKTNNPETVRAADRADRLAVRENLSARAGRDYADRLVALRGAETNLANARIDEAVAEKNFAAAEALRRNGLEPDVNLAQVMQGREEARTKVLDQERKVGALRDEANTSRLTWEDRRHAYNVAMAQPGNPPLPSIQAPGAPPQYHQVPLPEAGTPHESTPSQSSPDHTM